MKKIACFILIIVFLFANFQIINANTKNQKLKIIKPKYDELEILTDIESEPCDNDTLLLKFKSNSKYGILNQDGTILVNAIYDDVWSNYNGYIIVEKDDKFGYLDQSGKPVTKLIYDEYPQTFHDGMAAVSKDGKWGFIDTNGKEVIPLQYDNVFNYTDGVAPVCLDGKWGLINKAGAQILIPTYSQIGYIGEGSGIKVSFVKGIAQVQNTNGKWGYIDKTGKEIVKTEYDEAYDYRDGFAPFIKDKKWGLATENGIVLQPTYDYIYDFQNNDITFYVKNGKLGLLNRDMVELTKALYDKAGNIASNGYIAVMRDNKYGYINVMGKEVIKPKYEAAGTFYKGLAPVVIDGKIGYINKNNKLVIPAVFQDGDFDANFNFGTAIVLKNKKYGIINQDGKLLTKAEYQYISKNNNELYIIKKNGKYGVLDKNGKNILSIKYTHIVINNNIISANMNNSFSFFDLSGKKIIDKTFHNVKEDYIISEKYLVLSYDAARKKGALIFNTK